MMAAQAQTVVDGAVTADKLADGAVTAGKLADDSVVAGKLAGGSVTTEKLADNAVTGSQIAPASVGFENAAVENLPVNERRLHDSVRRANWLSKTPDPTEAITEAQIQNGSHGTLRAHETASALLRNLTILERLGCLDDAELDKLRRGNAPTITKGPYAGELAIPTSHPAPPAIGTTPLEPAGRSSPVPRPRSPIPQQAARFPTAPAG